MRSRTSAGGAVTPWYDAERLTGERGQSLRPDPADSVEYPVAGWPLELR